MYFPRPVAGRGSSVSPRRGWTTVTGTDSALPPEPSGVTRLGSAPDWRLRSSFSPGICPFVASLLPTMLPYTSQLLLPLVATTMK